MLSGLLAIWSVWEGASYSSPNKVARYFELGGGTIFWHLQDICGINKEGKQGHFGPSSKGRDLHPESSCLSSSSCYELGSLINDRRLSSPNQLAVNSQAFILETSKGVVCRQADPETVAKK